MSRDPMQKGGAPGFSDPIPPNRGRGSIDTNKGYASVKSLPGRIVFAILCIVPYLAIGVYLFISGLEIQAIVLLAIPLLLFLVFWFLLKKLDT